MAKFTKMQEWMAKVCVNCVFCRRARKKQKGVAYAMEKALSGICPFCRAYEKVYGRKSYEAGMSLLTHPGNGEAEVCQDDREKSPGAPESKIPPPEARPKF